MKLMEVTEKLAPEHKEIFRMTKRYSIVKVKIRLKLGINFFFWKMMYVFVYMCCAGFYVRLCKTVLTLTTKCNEPCVPVHAYLMKFLVFHLIISKEHFIYKIVTHSTIYTFCITYPYNIIIYLFT